MKWALSRNAFWVVRKGIGFDDILGYLTSSVMLWIDRRHFTFRHFLLSRCAIRGEFQDMVFWKIVSHKLFHGRFGQDRSFWLILTLHEKSCGLPTILAFLDKIWNSPRDAQRGEDKEPKDAKGVEISLLRS
jgi:hypothetical protein